MSPAGVCYLIHTFPLWSSTFVTDEIDFLRARSWRLKLFAVKRPRTGEYPPAFARFLSETTYVFPLRPALLLSRHLRMFASRPGAYLRALRGAISWGQLSLRNRGRTLVHFVEAVYVHDDLARAGCRHLHVHFASGSATIALFLKELTGLPYSLTAHGTDIFVERVLVAEKVSRSHFTRVGTARNRDYLLGLLPEGVTADVRVIPFGVDLAHAREHPGAPASGRGPLRLVNVGRLVWQKGQDTLLLAAACLRDQGLDFRLLVVGEGEERPRLEALRKRLGLETIVDMPGAMSTEAVSAAYRESDLFVLSSVSEGFGLVVVEAMSFGLPVVATALPGLDEIVEHGEEGWLVSPRSPEALAEAILALARDSETRRRMAKAGAAKASRVFDNQVVIGRFSELLASVAP